MWYMDVPVRRPGELPPGELIEPEPLGVLKGVEFGSSGSGFSSWPWGFDRWAVFIEHQRNTAKVAAEFECADR